MLGGRVRLHKDLRNAGINQFKISRSALLVFLERLQNVEDPADGSVFSGANDRLTCSGTVSGDASLKASTKFFSLVLKVLV